MHEALGVSGVDVRAGGADLFGAAVVDVGGVRHDPEVPVIFVEPGEEAMAERLCFLDRAESTSIRRRWA